jgi:hypothetical protein
MYLRFTHVCERIKIIQKRRKHTSVFVKGFNFWILCEYSFGMDIFQKKNKKARIPLPRYLLLSTLHLASYSDNLNIVKFLVTNGAKINAIDERTYNKEKALYTVAGMGHLDMVKILVANGVEIETKDSDNETSLHLAAKYGYIDQVKFLVAKGAKI